MRIDRPFIAALCCAALLTDCSGGSGGATGRGTTVVKIGVDLPLSGADASVGQSTLDGVTLAVEQANAKAPKGLAFRVDALDDAVQGIHSPQQGVANVRQFAADSSVLAVIGPYNSNVAKAEIPVTNAAGLVQIGPSVVADGLTIGPDALALRRANPHLIAFFRVCTIDSRQGEAAAQFAKQLGWKRAYVVDDNETYGIDLTSVFDADFRKEGGTVLGHDHLAKGTQDYKALLLKIASAKPDVLYYGGVTSTGGGLLRKQMFDTSLGKTPFMGGDGVADLNTVAGVDADGAYYTVAAPNANLLPSARAFVADYEKRFGTGVGAYSANAYAAAQVAIAAIETAWEADGGKLPARATVLKNVAATKLQTPIGTVSFDANGDVRNPIVSLYGFKNGKPSFIKQAGVTTQ